MIMIAKALDLGQLEVTLVYAFERRHHSTLLEYCHVLWTTIASDLTRYDTMHVCPFQEWSWVGSALARFLRPAETNTYG